MDLAEAGGNAVNHVMYVYESPKKLYVDQESLEQLFSDVLST